MHFLFVDLNGRKRWRKINVFLLYIMYDIICPEQICILLIHSRANSHSAHLQQSKFAFCSFITEQIRILLIHYRANSQNRCCATFLLLIIWLRQMFPEKYIRSQASLSRTFSGKYFALDCIEKNTILVQYFSCVLCLLRVY